MIKARCIAVVLLLCCCSALGQDAGRDFGMLVQSGGALHFYSSRPDLAAGSHIVVLDSGERFRIAGPGDGSLSAVIVLIRSNSAYAYPVSPSAPPRSPLAAIVESATSEPASASLRTSSCASSEGIHYSIWETRDGQESRVWSAYRYLDYAVEPSCSDGEWAE